MKINFKKYLLELIEDSLKQISPLGSYQFYLIILFILLFLEKYIQFLTLLLSLILLYILSVPIRLIFFRERPKKKKFSNRFEKIIASSMPSLHSARTIILLLFFINLFNQFLLFKIFLSILTIIILYSRVYLKNHYKLDILIGSILGALVYFLINLIV